MMMYELDLSSIFLRSVYQIIFQNVEVTSKSQTLAGDNIKELKKSEGKSWGVYVF